MNDGDSNRRNTRKVPLLDLQKLKVICALGRGAKGVVFLVKSEDGESLALKAISRASIEKNKKNDEHVSEYKRICFEKDVLASLEHPLFPKLRGLISTEQIVGYAIDYCPGRDLNTLRKKQTEKMFSDDIIRFYAAELVLALEYLHGLGIVYRDLKPENVMIQENGHLMLVDFDLSTRLQPKTPDTRRVMQSSSSPRSMQGQNNKKIKKLASFFKRYYSRLPEADSVHPVELDSDSASHSSQSQNVEKSNSFVGTEEYVAPEIISGKGHDFAVDWWCLGVMLYEMLYGTTPFRGVNRKETFYRILTKVPELVGEPTPLRNLIGKLLEKDPKRRITVEEIKRHDIFEAVDWDRILEIPRPPFIPVSEHTEGNKQIDVESFVQGVFKVGDNDDEKNVENKNKGVWAEGLNNPTNNQNELYSIF